MFQSRSKPVSNEISRVSADIDSAARAKAAADGVSLSAIVERALSDYLKAGAEQSDKPAWAIDHESRISQLEAQGQGNRKGKRR